MNISEIITRGLNRAKLSVNDVLFREFALGLLDEIIQDHWESKFWQFRQKPFTITAASGTEEYALDKLATVQTIVPNSMRGSDPIRVIKYRPAMEFYRTNSASNSGNPYQFREGRLKGFQTDPSSASVISFVSSLANYTTGTVTVANGSRRLVFSGATITLDMLGRSIRVASDEKTYKIVSRDYNSSSIYYLNEAYEGVSQSGQTFVIGDIDQKCTVLGYVSGQLQEEEIKLNGTTAVPTTKSFTSFLRITKEKTHGYVTATSNSGVVTNIILDPGETEAEFQTIKFDPIPSATETINYEAYIRHPNLYRSTDSPLFPSQYHSLLVIDLHIRLMEEWHGKSVTPETIRRRDALVDTMRAIDNNVDGWKILQESEESSERTVLNNLPVAYGNQDE